MTSVIKHLDKNQCRRERSSLALHTRIAVLALHTRLAVVTMTSVEVDVSEKNNWGTLAEQFVIVSRAVGDRQQSSW